MRTRNKIVFAGFVLALIAGLASSGHAQGLWLEKMLSGVPVAKTLNAVSTDAAMYVKYVGGAAGGGEVAVAAGGDITLTIGGVADTTTECPIAGAYGGVIDVQDASCNSLGEVCDAINFSANWRCVIAAGLRTDSADNTLLTIGATAADAKAGLALLWDTPVALTITQTLVPDDVEGIDFYVGSGIVSPPIIPNPFKDHQAALLYFSEQSAHTLNQVDFYSVTVNNQRGRINAAGTGFVGGTETVNTHFTATGGATGVASVWDFRNSPYLGRKGDKLIMRSTTTATLTVPVMLSWGYYFVP